MKKPTTIRLNRNGTGTVEIDGVDVSNSVSAVRIDADPTAGLTTVLTVFAEDVKVETDEVRAVLADLRHDATPEEVLGD